MTAPRLLVPLVLALCGALAAAEPVPANYAFTPGPPRLYLVETKQVVSWESAGDKLTFTSSLATSQAWKCTAVDHGTATVQVTILRVIASHVGPGSEHGFDSAEKVSGPVDPLLGHLKALEGVTLTMAIDQATGATRVSGGARIAEGIAKRAPNLVDPLAPSPLAAQAVQLYSDDNLSRTWSQTLARPTAQALPVPLGDPLTGTLLRTWAGDKYTLAGTVTGTAVLAKDPSPVTAAISSVSGSGSTVLAPDGWPGTAEGTLAFTLAIDALTQPVQQRHEVTWRLARLPPPTGGP